MSKTCFVIMGFGKKTDFSNGITYDLDKTYKNIIQPAVIAEGYACIRADEIQDSSIIDRSMYAFLIQADLVIADITTFNPNAIYELGIRHAVRPYSTIILKEKGGTIPFDINHTRIFNYKHLGEDIGKDEAERCINELRALINNITKNTNTDSPLYEFIGTVIPPILPKEEFDKIIGELAEKEKHIFAITEKALDCMRKSDFESAVVYWEKAIKLNNNDTYFKQQLALSLYKSKMPSELTSLTNALNIIEDLLPTNDPETLGITGSIYKNLYILTKDKSVLLLAIENYGKGFKISNNYYVGENYALCLNMISEVEDNADEKIYYRIEAKKTRLNILKSLEKLSSYDEIENRPDAKWIYATLAHCYYAIKNDIYKEYEAKFLLKALDWEKESYENSKLIIKELLAI